MTYENEFTSMSLRVPRSFRDKYDKQTDFWKELGDFFVKMAKHLTKADLNQLRIDNPHVFEFVEEVLPE